mgnify:CR=1 FL=1
MQLSSKILIGMLLGIAVGLLLNMINDASAEPVPMIAWLVENVFDLIEIESEKNNQVSLFYDDNGFDKVSDNFWAMVDLPEP